MTTRRLLQIILPVRLATQLAMSWAVLANDTEVRLAALTCESFFTPDARSQRLLRRSHTGLRVAQQWAPRHTIQGTLHSHTQSPTPSDRTAIICFDFLDALQFDFLLIRLFNAQDVGKPQQVLVSLPLEYSGAMGTSRKLFWFIKKKPMMLVSKSFH